MKPTIDWKWVKREIVRHEHIKKASILRALCEALNDARGLAQPKVVSALRPVPSIGIGGKRITSYLKNAEKACIFLVTIGGLLERAATKRMASGDALEGYLLDKAGSLAAESLAEVFEVNLRKEMARAGRSVSRRMSPGYCDWPIEDQLKLNRILRFSKAGVRLTQSRMMIPRKSVSGILGIGAKGVYSKAESLCTTCRKKDCTYKRE